MIPSFNLIFISHDVSVPDLYNLGFSFHENLKLNKIYLVISKYEWSYLSFKEKK